MNGSGRSEWRPLGIVVVVGFVAARRSAPDANWPANTMKRRQRRRRNTMKKAKVSSADEMNWQKMNQILRLLAGA